MTNQARADALYQLADETMCLIYSEDISPEVYAAVERVAAEFIDEAKGYGEQSCKFCRVHPGAAHAIGCVVRGRAFMRRIT